MNCSICDTNPIVICRPFDDFVSSEHGLFDDPAVALCERCNDLWKTQFFGTLASLLVMNVGYEFRGRPFNMSGAYRLVCQFEVLTRAKLN